MMRLLKPANLARALAVAFGLAAVAALGFLSIGGDGAEAANTHTVYVNDSKFCGSAGPGCTAALFSTSIITGDTVEWLDGQIGPSHTVTQCTGDGTGCPGGVPGFDSAPGNVNPPTLYLSETFNSAGTFFYRCQIHGNAMRGIITVSDPPTGVGGIADFPDTDEPPADASGSSGSSSLAFTTLVSGLVVALAMLAAGAWYARRRWLKTG